ncbi:MAG: murein biosynthesis integral membrane protein MurJ [Pseudomonadales bacterium]|jgi:putative peptidoglycan lipid II flippase|nr:murein biosynthesis integral membrane protein MurJ [Pseudomonadales bacterium]MDP6471573.1 murein biosynthesis integral membrane protein MurJ [Pseudomonadales bacterium]MDP6828836.1 murein biosynthesis integral membrane protein MurJ [Pseudomonadales bacterium]MDP6971722.1 murein biosynthesis integral membrane protein MurJ [Pseudomonadales bacterium]
MSTEPEVEERDIASQGTVVVSMTMLSRVSGFVRDILLSNFLGASDIADAFFVAFRIPNFFRRLFAEGAFNQAFVPVLSRYRERGHAELVRFAALIGGNLATVLVLFVGLGVLFSDALVVVFAPGFIDEPEKFAMTSEVVHITFTYLAFISLTAFAGAILNTFHRYAVPAFTPVLLNLSLIAAMLVGAALVDNMLLALAWGVFAAGVVQFLFQLPALARVDMLVAPRVGVQHEGVRRMGRLLVPALLAASVGQINALIDTILASTLISGSISWLYYSDRLLELPIGLVAVALGTVLLPNLSRLAETSDEQFAGTLDWGLRMGVVLAMPASLALYLLAVPLISTIFFHGEMTSLDVTMAALALQAFAVGVVALVLVKVLAPAFFAHQDTRTPLRYASVAVGVNVVGNLAMFSWFGHVGLALATSISGWVHLWLLFRGVRERGFYAATAGLRRMVVLSVLASIVMGVVLIALTPSDGYWLSIGNWQRVGWLATVVGIGLSAYSAMLFVCGVRPGELRHRV